MSLLQQDNTELDDAARGQSFSKGTSHVTISAVVATVVVSLAIAVYVIAGEKPLVVKGEIFSVTAHLIHTQTSGREANGAPSPQENFGQVYGFSHVRLHNQSN